MARTSNITFGQVAQIADAMKAAGNRPTARAVRERIGSGSMGTIHKFLQQWQGKTNESDEETEAAELPAHIQNALMDFIGTEIATACEPLNDQLQQAKADAEEIALDNERINKAYEQQSADVERLMIELANAMGQLMTTRDEFMEVKAERDQLQSTTNEQARNIDRLERQLELFATLPLEVSDLKRSNDTLRVQYATAYTERAVLSTRIDAGERWTTHLTDRLEIANKRNEAQEAELKAAQATAQRATAELGSVARTMAEAKTAAQPVKIVKSAAKKATTKIPVNQELNV